MKQFDRYPSLTNATTPEKLLEAIAGLADDLRFPRYSAMMVIDHPSGGSDFHDINNVPAGYEEEYNRPGSGKDDPVMQHCKHPSVPIIWDRMTYESRGLAGKWEFQADYGYQTGIALAIHLPYGKRLFIGLDRTKALPNDEVQLTKLLADLQLFAVHAQEAASRVLLPSEVAVELPSLTLREMEALRWTLEGKTAWEVSVILGISERTATAHLNNATHKLGCINKYVAAFKALKIGLIR